MTDAAATRAWQPWTPTVGDRVVCRPSPECRAWCARMVGAVYAACEIEPLEGQR